MSTETNEYDAPASVKPIRIYQKPEVTSSEAFERLALSCSGVGGIGGPSKAPRTPCTVGNS